MRQLYMWQKKMRRRRQEAIKRFVADLGQSPPSVVSIAAGNIFAEARGNRIT